MMIYMRAAAIAALSVFLVSTGAYAQHEEQGQHNVGQPHHKQGQQHKPGQLHKPGQPRAHGNRHAPQHSRLPVNHRDRQGRAALGGTKEGSRPARARPPTYAHPGAQQRRDHAVQAHGHSSRREWSRYYGNVTAGRRYRAREAWHAPRGYSYRRFRYGERLPRVYFTHGYWLTNYLLYGLMPPPPNFVWVRVGPDALLVDRYTGEIIRVEYNAFY